MPPYPPTPYPSCPISALPTCQGSVNLGSLPWDPQNVDRNPWCPRELLWCRGWQARAVGSLTCLWALPLTNRAPMDKPFALSESSPPPSLWRLSRVPAVMGHCPATSSCCYETRCRCSLDTNSGSRREGGLSRATISYPDFSIPCSFAAMGHRGVLKCVRLPYSFY